VNFIGEMFTGIFIGMMILSLAVYREWIKVNASPGEIWPQALGVCFLMATGACFAPLIITIVEKKIQEKLPGLLDYLLNIRKGEGDK